MSDNTKAVVDRTLLKTCAVSRQKGESVHFEQHALMKADVPNELG